MAFFEDPVPKNGRQLIFQLIEALFRTPGHHIIYQFTDQMMSK